MCRLILLSLLALLLALIPGIASAATITQWCFDSANTVPCTGSGTASSGTGLGIPAGGNFPQGNPDTGLAWSFDQWTTASSLDLNDYFQFAASADGFQNIAFSFDERRSGTGIRTFELHYSTDGTNFTYFATVNVPDDTNWRSHAFDLSSITALNDNPNAAFRIYGYSAEGGAGTWRIDNVTIGGDSIPTTVTLSDFAAHTSTQWGLGASIAIAALGLAGAGSLWLRRRR